VPDKALLGIYYTRGEEKDEYRAKYDARHTAHGIRHMAHETQHITPSNQTHCTLRCKS